MSNLEHDEDLAQQKLFNSDVIRLLFRYVFRYRRYLYYSLVFVAFTTATTLYVPVVTRDIIDKYVVNAGYTVKKNIQSNSPEQKLFNRIIDKQSIVLDTQQVFIYQNVLKKFSRKYIDSLRNDKSTMRPLPVMLQGLILICFFHRVECRSLQLRKLPNCAPRTCGWYSCCHWLY